MDNSNVRNKDDKVVSGSGYSLRNDSNSVGIDNEIGPDYAANTSINLQSTFDSAKEAEIDTEVGGLTETSVLTTDPTSLESKEFDIESLIYDTIIIGAGAAGCSAGIYATRFNLKTLIIAGPMPGGLISEALEVENYPGYLSINGQELAKKFIDQAVKLGAEYKNESVEKVEKIGRIGKLDELFEVFTSKARYKTKTVILATGTHHRKLGIHGEQEFAGRGVSYCSTCDAPFFKDKIVAVVGGGNSAVEGAQDVAVHAKHVYLIYRSELKAAPFYTDNLRRNPRIVELSYTNVLEIQGQTVVDGLKLDKPFNNSDLLKVDGVFIEVGYIPMNDLAKGLGLDLSENGYVKVNAGMGTNLNGVFCAGDLSDGSNHLHQQITSASEGAIAAQSAYRYIHGGEYLIKA